jgi:hypothetical protein
VTGDADLQLVSGSVAFPSSLSNVGLTPVPRRRALIAAWFVG